MDPHSKDTISFACVTMKKWSTEKILTAICLYLEMIAWGMFIGVINSSFLDLELLTNTTTAQISLLWTAITIGSGCMTPFAGFVLDKSDCRLFIGLNQLGFGCLIVCLPLARNFVQVMALACTLGIFLGFLDIGRNMTALTLWGWDGAMWLQFYHFIFAVGSAVSPLFTRPFLAMPLYDKKTSQWINATISTITDGNTTEGKVAMSESRIHIVFTIIGVLMFIGGIYSITTFLILRNIKKQNCQQKKAPMKVTSFKQDRWYVICTVILMFFRCCFIVGVEVTFGALLMTFLVKGLGWTKSDAVMAVFTFRISFAVTRGVGVGLATFVTPTKLMFVDIALFIISIVMLWLSGIFPSATWLIWVSTGLAGCGCATFFSASLSWTEKYLGVSGRLGGFFLLGGHCGVLAFPALAGYLLQTYNPWAFVYICFGILIMLLIVTTASVILGQWYRKRHPNQEMIENPELTSLN